MPATDSQVVFFQHLKSLLPAHLSMADEVADLLEISPDSAYRRIRGEKPISLEELRKICVRYKMSVDHLLHLQSDCFIFSGRLKQENENSFEEWLNYLHQQFQFVQSLPQKHLYSLLKDISPFVHFQIPELATFKFYLWMKSILHYESLKGVKFDFADSRYERYHATSKKIIAAYNKVPTSEIWNIESMNSTLRQIQFHHEAGSFKNKSDVILLYNKVEELVNHIERQAEAGVKFNVGEEPSKNGTEFNMYVNELILGDNTILVEAGNTRLTFLNHSVLYFVHTRDEAFNKQMYNHLQTVIKKSTIISRVSEKERVTFFNRLREGIHQKLAEVHA